MIGRSAFDVKDLPETSGVYRIVNTATGECYVGSTTNIRKRCYQHAILLANGDHHSRVMQRSFVEHGADVFQAEVVDACDLMDLSAREEAWIGRLCPEFNIAQRVSLIRVPRPRKPKNRSVARRDATADAYRRAARMKLWNDVAELLRSGKPTVEITAACGVNEQYVARVRREAGLPARKRGRKPGRSEAFAKRLAELESIDWNRRDADIASDLKLSRERVRQIRLMLGKPHMTLSQSVA